MENGSLKKGFLMFFWQVTKNGMLCDIEVTWVHYISVHVYEIAWNFIKPYKRAKKMGENGNSSE